MLGVRALRLRRSAAVEQYRVATSCLGAGALFRNETGGESAKMPARET